MKSKKKRISYEDLVNEIRVCDLHVLIDIYIETKTGDSNDFDKLPESFTQQIDDIDEMIDQIAADNMSDGIIEDE